MDSKRLVLCASFGGAAFALRALNIIVPIGGPFVIDPRGVPGIVGAALTGPIGGLIIGVLAGAPAALPVVDVPSFGLAYFLVGVAVYALKRHKWLGGLTVLSGHVMAAWIVWQMGLVPSFSTALILISPRAAALVPLQIFLLYVLFKRWPNLDTLT